LNTECAVSPLGSNKEAIPNNIMARTICIFDRNLKIKVFYR